MKRFAVSYIAVKSGVDADGPFFDTSHDLEIIEADSAEDAQEKALKICQKKCQYGHGWQDHSALAVEIEPE